jgi:hypothetical protein
MTTNTDRPLDLELGKQLLDAYKQAQTDFDNRKGPAPLAYEIASERRKFAETWIWSNAETMLTALIEARAVLTYFAEIAKVEKVRDEDNPDGWDEQWNSLIYSVGIEAGQLRAAYMIASKLAAKGDSHDN